MKKEEFQQYVFDKNGKNLDLDKFDWDEEERTFTSKESGLSIIAPDLDNCTFDTGSNCRFKTRRNCIFNTSNNCTFKTKHSCIFITTNNCTFKTGDDCFFEVGEYCTFDTGNDCYFIADTSCTFCTGKNCNFFDQYGRTLRVEEEDE